MRPALLKMGPLSKTLKSSVKQRQTIQQRTGQYWCWTARHDTLQALQALGTCSACKVLGTILQLMPQLGTKFPLRCCSKRRWTRSALANQQIMQMRAF